MLFTLNETFVIAALAMVAVLAAVETIARLGHGSFLSSVVMGSDNRTSTSKTFVFLWTLLVGWAMLSMLFAGEFVRTHLCAATSLSIRAAIAACMRSNDQLGLMQVSWRNFEVSGLSGSYLILLGLPAAAAVIAKAITQNKIDGGTLSKPPATDRQTVASRVVQIFSADDATTDIGDFQYAIFNLLLALYFVAEFVQPKGEGLPVIPDTLLGLTTVSAGVYISKKAVSRTRANISAAFPSILRVGQPVTVVGTGLTIDPAQPASAGASAPQVAINGVQALHVAPDPAVADRLTATVPQGVVPSGTNSPIAATIQVVSAYGSITPGFGVQVME